MQEISGAINKPIMDAFEITGEQVEIPEGIEDFHITIIGETGYIETKQKWSYDPETGCLYFIEEVK